MWARRWGRSGHVVVLGVVLVIGGACGAGADGSDADLGRAAGLTGTAAVDELCRAAGSTMSDLDLETDLVLLREASQRVVFPELNDETASVMRRVDLSTDELGPVSALSQALLDVVGNMDDVLDALELGDIEVAGSHLLTTRRLFDEIDRQADVLGVECDSDVLAGRWYEVAQALFDAEATPVPITGDFAVDALAVCDRRADAFVDPFVLDAIVLGGSTSVGALQRIELELGRLVEELGRIEASAGDERARAAIDHLTTAQELVEVALTGYAVDRRYDASTLSDAIRASELAATELAGLGVECGPYAALGYLFTPGPADPGRATCSRSSPSASCSTTVPDSPTASASDCSSAWSAHEAAAAPSRRATPDASATPSTCSTWRGPSPSARSSRRSSA